MSDKTPLRVVLCWHMHQPNYRDPVTHRYQAPWTYLHAIKDYVDMAAHLEAVPEARAVVNFSPTLLAQLGDYRRQCEALLAGAGADDPLLEALAQPVIAGDREARAMLIRACLRVNRGTVIERFAPFAELATGAQWLLDRPHLLMYMNDQFLVDLLVWYHLGWLGETVRRGDERARRLIAHGRNFSLADRLELLRLIAELIQGVIPRYRALAERGQIELSVTPYSHPIVPLLLDFRSAREAWPDCVLPASDRYPGGCERVDWQLAEARRAFEGYFGRPPAGCWPSEGGVSMAAVRHMGRHGFGWVASGQAVLHNSLGSEHDAPDAYHRPYRLNDGGPVCFFRDDGLSDAIGFVYQSWHADDAVSNLIHHLETIADDGATGDGRVVSIILDGENAWEHYPENGYHFLSALYRRLSAHPRLRLTTFSDCLADDEVRCRPLSTMVAGSWVYGTFSTWIGDSEKNRAWEMLVDAKRVYDDAVEALDEDARQRAQSQLAVCEASDWFWWLGDDNPEAVVSQFERLFRLQLAGLYRLLGHQPPAYLSEAFTHGTGHGAVATMRRAQ